MRQLALVWLTLAVQIVAGSGLRKEVAAQSGKALTSEAAALVDVNIEYALRRAKSSV